MAHKQPWAFLLLAFALAIAGLRGEAATLDISLDSRTVYAEVPFVLIVDAKGFEEDPIPDPPALTIDNCEVTYLGVTPKVTSHFEISVNGRSMQTREVVYSYRWRVVAPQPGRYLVPALSVTQGTETARTRPANIEVRQVTTTEDMTIRLELPQRTIWVGEAFDAVIEWLLQRDASNINFKVPLFEVDGVRVEPPEDKLSGKTLPFQIGPERVDLPYSQNKAGKYTRVLIPARVTLPRAGAFELEPVRVTAELVISGGRDVFRSRRTQRYTATGAPQRIVISALPTAGRPASFVNAIGGGFSIDVQASRTVVSVGEPIALAIRLRGSDSLEGISLPALDGPGALPRNAFSVLEAAEVGINEDDTTKRFDASIRVLSEQVTAIPPIEFAFFDPQAAEYRTVRSAPIALSVGQGTRIGAGDVESTSSTNTPRFSRGAGGGEAAISLIGADMSLSDDDDVFDTVTGGGLTFVLVFPLYVGPFAFLGWQLWNARTATSRRRRKEVDDALHDVQKALQSNEPLSVSGPRIINTMRSLARISGHAIDHVQELEAVETQSYDPASANRPLDASLMNALLEVAGKWAAQTAILLFAAVLLFASAPVLGNDAEELNLARTAYLEALTETDRTERLSRFEDAEQRLRRLSEAHPDAPELLADWGNAALGAENLGHAVLAYRRTLSHDPRNDRALENLTWIRDRLPVWLPRPDSGAVGALLFWQTLLSATEQAIVGSLLFALGALLLIPIPAIPITGGRILGASLCFLAWLALVGSALLRSDSDAVVIADGIILRAADSLGAPSTFANPLPAGTEVEVIDTRGGWYRISLADGTTGWISTSSARLVEG